MSTAFRRIRRSGRALPEAPRPGGGRPWTPALLLAAVLVGCSGDSSSLTGFFGFAQREPAIDDLTVRQQRQLELFSSTVRNPSPDIDPATRLQAAEELIEMNSTEATARLADALRSDEPVVVLAVIDAMEMTPEPVASLLPAAAETLQEATGERLEKLSLVLPRYGPDALELVAVYARDVNEPPARRIGPIYALAAFRSRQSALELMAFLDEQRLEPPEITAAAGASLQRLTGLPYGADAHQWRQWWEQLKDEPIENWLRVMVLHLNTRTSELEREILHHNQESAEIARRLAETLRELFLTLTLDEQLERLPTLLDDELAPVRAFALGRIERRLRDSSPVPESLQIKLAQRLNDPAEEPASRLLAAQLLNDLNYGDTAILVATALDDQSNPAIARGYLEILVRRPVPGTAQLILLWLDNPTAGDAAADALWVAMDHDMIEAEELSTTHRAARAAFAQQSTPSHARLLAAMGESADRAAVEQLLDDPDPALRRAAAEGLSRAGAIEPLRDRLHDPEIYPFVIALVARGPADVATLQSLAELEPPEAHRTVWANSIRSVARRLPPSTLVAADAMLESVPYVDPQLRIDILAGVPDLAADTLPIDQRGTLLLRLARLHLAMGAPDRAYEVLAWPNGSPMTPAFANLKFQAAVLAGLYDKAFQLDTNVKAWIGLLNQLMTDDRPETASAVMNEITRRFSDQLQGEAGELFQAAEERLTQAIASADSPSTRSTP